MFLLEHPEVWDFVDNYETWNILNGSTTNVNRDFEGIPAESINQIADNLEDNDV